MSGGEYPPYPPAYYPPAPSGPPYGSTPQAYGGPQYPASPPNYSQPPYGAPLPQQGYEPPPPYAPPGHQQFGGPFIASQSQQYGESFSTQYGGPPPPATQSFGLSSPPCEGYSQNNPPQHLYPTLPLPVPPPPQGFNFNFDGSTTEKSRQGGPVPQRPAPPPPHHPSAPPAIGFGMSAGYPIGNTPGHLLQGGPAHIAGGAPPFEPTAGFVAPSSPPQPLGPWKDTPLPPFLREAWQCGSSTRVYLQQHDGFIVAPNGNTFLRVYLNTEFDFGSCPSRRGSLSTTHPTMRPSSGRNSPAFGAVQSPTGSLSPPAAANQQYSLLAECPGVCRVKLSPVRGHVLVTSARDYIAFVDQGTNPCRSVVVALPKDLDQTHLQKLLTLLESNGSLTTENGGVVTTATSTVESDNDEFSTLHLRPMLSQPPLSSA